MDYSVKTYEIAGGIVAYTWIDGHQVNGRGADEEAARADLRSNMELDRRLRDKCAQAHRSGLHGVSIP